MRLLMIFVTGIQIVQLNADQPAITADGKRVLLLSNGTWRYATVSEQRLFEKSEHFSKNNETSGGQEVTGKVLMPLDKSRTSLIDIVRNDTSFDFRNVRWGMSKAQVKNAEKAKQIKSDNEHLQYDLEFLGYTCQVIYFFEKDCLKKAELKIKQDHVDPARYFRDYEELKKYLKPIYGVPVSDRMDWKNEMYSNDPSKWGFAVSIGFLSCRTTWRNNRTLVSLNISGGNHQITTVIEYSED